MATSLTNQPPIDTVNPESFADKFTHIKDPRAGGFGAVHLAGDHETSTLATVKIIKKEKTSSIPVPA